jgi:hypothetical protein
MEFKSGKRRAGKSTNSKSEVRAIGSRISITDLLITPAASLQEGSYEEQARKNCFKEEAFQREEVQETEGVQALHQVQQPHKKSWTPNTRKTRKSKK